MSSSSTLSSNEQNKDWLDLPYDITTNILNRIGVLDILENVQKVCTAWHKICKDPSIWRVIKIRNFYSFQDPRKYMPAVDRSQGQLVDITITIEDPRHTELLSYVANRSSQLKRLEIIIPYQIYSEMYTRISQDLMKLPYLEELNVYSLTGQNMKKEIIETAGRYCPMLKTLKVNQRRCNVGFDDDEVAIAIGENFHEIRHLELIGNNMSNIGLQVILDGCLQLEKLDLRNCFRVDLDGDLGKRCVEQIKSLKLPIPSLEVKANSYNNEEESESDDDDY